MSDEEFQNFKEFMLQSQAQAAVRMSNVEESMGRLVDIFGDFAIASLNRFNALEDKVTILVRAQIKTEEKMRELR